MALREEKFQTAAELENVVRAKDVEITNLKQIKDTKNSDEQESNDEIIKKLEELGNEKRRIEESVVEMKTKIDELNCLKTCDGETINQRNLDIKKSENENLLLVTKVGELEVQIRESETRIKESEQSLVQKDEQLSVVSTNLKNTEKKINDLEVIIVDGDQKFSNLNTLGEKKELESLEISNLF
jgi:chromosome segregation ATPase